MTDSFPHSSLDPEEQATLRTELEARLLRAAFKHDRLDALPGPEARWKDPAKKPTHCLWQPTGQPGYAVPIDDMPRLMSMMPEKMNAYLDAHCPVIVPAEEG